MILIDLSSILHRMVHVAKGNAESTKVDGKYLTEDFVGLAKHYILEDLLSVQQQHKINFGEIVICLDNASGGYWREDVYSGYKEGRKSTRENGDIHFKEVFSDINGLIKQIQENLPWKCISVPRAEADDIMLVLAKEYSDNEKILIYSPDKDMIQAQQYNDNVFQYSALTKKWLKAENKHNNMKHWIQEHCVLGDSSDGVPKVVEHTEFSESFLKHLVQHNYFFKNPIEFRQSDIPTGDKINLIQNFNVYKTNRAGVNTGVKDVYKSMRFGPTALQKQIDKFGSIDNWLDSHPLYRPHYDRNVKLVTTEGIPTNIWNEIIVAHKESKVDYNKAEFEQYLSENDLQSVLMNLSGVFTQGQELTVNDFDW